MKPGHGGKREGAGRKPLGGETVTVYIAGWRKAALEEQAAKSGTNWRVQILIAIDRMCGLG